MSKTSDDAGKIRWWAWLLDDSGKIRWWAWLLLVVCVWGGVTFCIFPKLVGDVEVRGQWGDSFGMINALFSGLALAGVIYVSLLQKKELELQRFESSFFQLLGLHNDIVNSMEISSTEISFLFRKKRTVYQGRKCFGRMLGEFRNIFLQDEGIFWDEWHKDSPEDRRKFINHKYEKFFDQYQSQVGYYFRNLYNLVKFVDEKSDFPKDHKDKKSYTNLIRAQLSSDELGLLFYNCLSKRGDKFKVLVEKYALLEDMDFKKLVEKLGEGFEVTINEEHKSLYDESAYGESKE